MSTTPDLHPSNAPTVVHSSRSSFTYAELSATKPASLLQISHENLLKFEALNAAEGDNSEIAARGEGRTMYGGDEIQEPPVRTPQIEYPGLPQTNDPHMVNWDGTDDPENPQNWSLKYKWFITVIAIITCMNVTFASSAPSAASQSIARDFNVPKEVSYLITTSFLLGFVFGPLFWGPGSELVGRRPIFIGPMIIYTLLHPGQALAHNIEILLATRFLSAFFAVAPLTSIGGFITDIWSPAGRGPATSLFTASVFLGPVLGPIAEGFVLQNGISWRWIFWIMMIFAGACTLILIATLPETYAPIILLKKARKLRRRDPELNKDLYAEHEKGDWSAKGIIDRTLCRTFKMLFLEPILLLTTIYISIVYGLLYSLLQAVPIIFIGKYGFSTSHEGLIFIGIGIGTAIGALINWKTVSHYPKLIDKWRGFPPPEERLYGSMIGSPLLVIGIFWLGWTGNYPTVVPWYVPALSTVFVGTGISLIFMSFLSYLADTYLMYSASAFAANTICRSALAAAFPLFTVQMFNRLGVNWACTLIGLISLLFVPCPFLFHKFGALIRRRSKFAPCIDLEIAERLKGEEEGK